MDMSRPVNIAWPSKVGVIVGTHGSAPYIHLHLALREKYWPSIPILVHDDSSEEVGELRSLCIAHGADYTSTKKRLGGALGDLAAFSAGLDWANNNGVDLLVKLSRRFVITTPWVDDLQRLAFEGQRATYTSRCEDYGYAFRSECVALHVPSWYCSDAHHKMRQAIANGVAPAEVMEYWYHQQAKLIDARSVSCGIGQRERRKRVACHPWPLMGHGRHTASPGVFWHNSHTADEYYLLARALGIDNYVADDYRWVDASDTGNRVRFYSPPTAFSIETSRRREPLYFGEAAIKATCLDASKTALHGELLQRAKTASVLSKVATQARISGRISQTAFDILRWIRVAASPIRPFTAARAYDGSVCIVRVNRKKSVREAIAMLRDECFARFVCQKSAERPGMLLVVGDPPQGLLRLVGRDYGQRISVAIAMQSIVDAAVVSATAVANGWGNVSVVTPVRGLALHKCIEAIGGTDVPRISMLVVNIPASPRYLIETATRLLARHAPQVLIMLQDNSRLTEADIDTVRDEFRLRGYACALTGTGPDANGTLQPLAATPGVRRKAIYAAPAAQEPVHNNHGVADASLVRA
ncbi:MAG TPA: hypothetical protein VGK19_14580 [Capsulimonadaceae bacterium]|jgi:hypothetical protein